MPASDLRPMVPILRIFKAHAHLGCEAALAEKLATASAERVRHQAGLLGFLASGPADDTGRGFVFITIWRDAAALKAFFGEEWSVALLPPGYADLIEASSVEHYHLTEHFQAHETGRASSVRRTPSPVAAGIRRSPYSTSHSGS